MTDVYGPFDGTTWTQSQWYRDAPFWTPSGVFGSPASSTSTGDLALTTSGLNITIGTGRAHVRGASFERSGTPASQAVTTNGNASLSRRDRVVLRRDLAAKTVIPVVIAGTPSSSPTPPAITQVENGQWDSPLYSFLVPPNNGTGLSSFIDERAWVNPASPGAPAFSTTAARDAHFPSPAEAQLCVVADQIHEYVGGQWAVTGPYRVASGLDRWDGTAWRPVIAKGTGTLTPAVGANTLTGTQPFGVTFVNAPVVLITGVNSGTEYQWAFWARNVSTTSFDVLARWTSSGGAPAALPFTFQWMAFGT